MKIYLIAECNRHTCGHGESCETWELTEQEAYNPKPFPAFLSKEKAIKYYKECKIKQNPNMKDYYERDSPDILVLDVIE
jgi:hypothetical protein